jgi:hypothetical protein
VWRWRRRSTEVEVLGAGHDEGRGVGGCWRSSGRGAWRSPASPGLMVGNMELGIAAGEEDELEECELG